MISIYCPTTIPANSKFDIYVLIRNPEAVRKDFRIEISVADKKYRAEVSLSPGEEKLVRVKDVSLRTLGEHEITAHANGLKASKVIYIVD